MIRIIQIRPSRLPLIPRHDGSHRSVAATMGGNGINLKPAEVAAAFGDEDLRRAFPPILDVKRLAELLGKSPKPIYGWIEKGRLDGTFRKRGKGHLLWRDRVLDRLFNGPDWESDDDE